MRRLWLSVAILLAAFFAEARADVFVLVSGGRIEGELVNADESPRLNYVVKTSAGAVVTLDKAQVKEVVRQRPEEVEYERIRPQHPDTVEGQLALAEWCRQHSLLDARKRHLERVIELDPEQASARAALGFSRIDGVWKTQEQVMTERGYVKYKGSWKLPQEIELLENRRKNELAEKDWFAKVKRWRGWLNDERAREGAQQLVQIRDPYAVPALEQYLKTEPLDAVRKMYIEALAKVGTPGAYRVLAQCALHDPVEEVRQTCLDNLVKEPHPDAVELFMAALRDKDNALVNRAAACLARMKDPVSIGPLIDALVTTHKYKIVTGQQGSIGASFDPNGGVNGFSAGGGPKIITQVVQNEAVLNTLLLLAPTVNYNYDIPRWKLWHATQKKSAALDARRD